MTQKQLMRELRRRRRENKANHKREAKLLLKQGYSHEELARKFNCSLYTIFAWDNSIFEYEEHRDSYLIPRAKELREKGYSYNDISKDILIPKKTIMRWLKGVNNEQSK